MTVPKWATMEKTTGIYLHLTEKLLKSAQEAAQRKGFASLEEFLRSLLKKEVHFGDEESISAEEKEKIKEKLRRLGYLE